MSWNTLNQLDQQITLAINSWNSSFTDPIWAFLSMKTVWIPLYLAIIGLLVWKLGWKKALFIVLGVALTVGFCDQFANLLKNSTCRIRPVNDPFMVEQGLNILEWGGGYSFFSAHAANSFGIAGCTFMGLKLCLAGSTEPKDRTIVRIYAYIIFIWASLVAISRIFVGKHYTGDVIVGTIVGIAAGLFFGWLSYKAIRRFI